MKNDEETFERWSKKKRKKWLRKQEERKAFLIKNPLQCHHQWHQNEEMRYGKTVPISLQCTVCQTVVPSGDIQSSIKYGLIRPPIRPVSAVVSPSRFPRKKEYRLKLLRKLSRKVSKGILSVKAAYRRYLKKLGKSSSPKRWMKWKRMLRKINQTQ